MPYGYGELGRDGEMAFVCHKDKFTGSKHIKIII